MLRLRKNQPHLGVGLYSIEETARLIGAPASTLRGWIGDRGLLPRTLDPGEQTLTFVELIELHFIKLFCDEGVSLQTIRKASRAATKRFRTDYPFSVKRFDTDGKTVFATLIGESRDGVLVEDLKRGQYVFEKVMRPFFRKLDYDTHEVARFWPREKSGRVVLDPARKFGKPIDAASGVSTRVILDAVQAGQDSEEVALWLNIPIAAVRAAVDFEQSLVA